MSIISPVLPQVQALSEGEMLDTVTIHPATVSQSAYGGKTTTEGSDVSTIGRVSPLSLKDLEGVIAGELRTEDWQTLTIPRDVGISGDDRVTVVSARNGTTTEYTVEQVVPRSTFAVHRKAIVRPV